jgi:hypothetical protein
VCSLNPIYGQGMTVAALQAQVLHRHVERGAGWRPSRYLDDIGRISAAAWSLALAGDLSFPLR